MRTPHALLLLLLLACGTTDPQEQCRATCGGCCREGVCWPGNAVEACGAPGAACDVCVQGQVCGADLRCGFGGGGGGSGAAGGAGSAGGTGTAGGSPTAGGSTAGGTGTAGGSATAGGTGCTPETDAELCAGASRVCGSVTRVDRCGATRTIASCGTCSSSLVCVSGACVCQPETNAQLCARLNATCGTLNANDNCNNPRTVACGTCATPNTCTGNTCSCTSETDAQLCTRLGRSCGALTAVDNCGRSRTVASCGSCVMPNTCTATGQCTCPSETNAQFCARLGATCGPLSGTDTCGQTRNVSSCGSCTGFNTCGGGGMANQCGCTPRTAAVICQQAGKDCGALSAANGCGMTVTVMCGTCGGAQTCGGGGVTNVCGCTPETNAQFCARLGTNCGSVTSADNCGVSRTASCGTSCPYPQTCGGGGSANVCGCTGETDAQLCASLGGGVCGTPTVSDRCLVQRAPSCGGCTMPQTCGGAGAPNRCGQPWSGSWSWEYPKPSGETLTAVHAVAPNDVWFAGEVGTLLHWNGTSLTKSPSPTTATLNDLWASGPSDVWAVGAGGRLLRYDGVSWSARPAPDAGTSGNFESVWGLSPTDVRVLQPSRTQHRWSGTSWSSSPIGTSGSLSMLTGTSANDLWAVGSQTWQFNGLDWVNRTPSYVTLYHVLDLGPQEVWASGYYYNSSTGGSSYPVVYRFDGGTWAGGQPVGVSSSDSLGAIWGATGNDLWLSPTYSRNCPLHRTTGSWSCVDGGFSPNDIHGTSTSDVWFAGSGGQVARWNGASLSRLSAPLFPSGCDEVSVVSASVAFEACVDRIVTVDPNAGTFSTTPVPGLAAGESLTDLWAASATQVWASTNQGHIYFFDGATLTVATTFAGSNFRALWGASPTDIWAGTAAGGILHFDGATWSAATAPMNGGVVDLWGSSASDVYALGNQGAYLHWDGATWSRIAVTMSPAFYPQKIHGSSPTNVWALDGWYGGYVLHFNGTSWSRITVLGFNSLDSLFVASDSDVFTTYGGTLYWYNGSYFTPTLVTGTGANALWAASPRDITWFAPTGVLRYR